MLLAAGLLLWGLGGSIPTEHFVDSVVPTMATGSGRACHSFDNCISLIEQTRGNRPPEAMPPQQDALNDELLRQNDAIPKLVNMLADPNLGRANIAAAALRQAPYIDPRYLPQIERGIDRGLDWLPPALGRIPSNAAAREAVRRLMGSKDAPDNQEGYAVVLSGKRAIPYIVDLARCHAGCQRPLSIILGSVLAQMGANAAGAVTPLMAIASDRTSPREIAVDAVEMLASMGEIAQPADRALLALRSKRPSLTPVIDHALIETHSPEAGSIYAGWLAESGGDVGQLRNLGEIGRAGYSAGPEVVTILRHSHGETRVSAAQALGLIGYRPGVPALIDALNDTMGFENLVADDQAILRRAHRDPCPGVALGRFDGKHDAYAVALVRQSTLRQIFVVVSPLPNGQTKISKLDIRPEKVDVLSVVSRIPPGVIETIDGSKILMKHDGIGIEALEAGMLICYYDGHQYRSAQVRD